MLFHGYELGRVGRDGNGEDVIGCFDSVEEVLVANHLEAEGWFFFASRADYAGKQQHTAAIFHAGDGQHVVVMVVCALNAVRACGERFPGDDEVIRDVHNELIEFLGPGGSG